MIKEPNSHARFEAVVADFDLQLGVLLASPPYKFGQVPIGIPKAGVYLFSENGTHLYVGRSKRLRERYFLHCRPGSRQNQASFAYKLAREKLNLGAASYSATGSRAAIATSEAFTSVFEAAKARIRSMEYRFIDEPDQARQALFEAYCALVLDTPYNNFDTH